MDQRKDILAEVGTSHRGGRNLSRTKGHLINSRGSQFSWTQGKTSLARPMDKRKNKLVEVGNSHGLREGHFSEVGTSHGQKEGHLGDRNFSKHR